MAALPAFMDLCYTPATARKPRRSCCAITADSEILRNSSRIPSSNAGRRRRQVAPPVGIVARSSSPDPRSHHLPVSDFMKPKQLWRLRQPQPMELQAELLHRTFVDKGESRWKPTSSMSLDNLRKRGVFATSASARARSLSRFDREDSLQADGRRVGQSTPHVGNDLLLDVSKVAREASEAGLITECGVSSMSDSVPNSRPTPDTSSFLATDLLATEASVLTVCRADSGSVDEYPSERLYSGQRREPGSNADQSTSSSGEESTVVSWLPALFQTDISVEGLLSWASELQFTNFPAATLPGRSALLKFAVLVSLLGLQPCLSAWARPEAPPWGTFDVGNFSEVQSGFASAFLLIFFSEIGDKTFFIAALLASRRSSVAVFSGTFGALAVMTVISVFLGRIFHYIDGVLPSLGSQKLPLDDIAAVVLLVFFGVSTLLEASTMDDSGEEQQEAELAIAGISAGGAAAGTVVATFALVFVAEWGDKSFFSTIALAAASSPLGVVSGAIAGHGAATILAVLGGSFLGNYISEKIIAYIGGVLFLSFAGVTLFEIFN